ncbi:flagellar biosynthetic protein FliO [Lysobacter ciconiae]|uniref:Flagellar biosynthetic protein FliO n=1 Tax=Novilysobacter ciconiae TaxID=2781022 RepID=A0A7S6ZSX7_9GAMM|nr:flagellar biosynthetic protein FliO [Lysobacter ciconiae]QOW20342.1 flagellar biosynthetic protein FliO [Lysobacter ciconiae]
MADTTHATRNPIASTVIAAWLALSCFTARAGMQDPTVAEADLAAAAGAPVVASGSLVWDLVAVVVPLLLVIAGLVAVLFFARRRYRLTGRDAALSIVQVLPVGPRERVVVLRTRADRVFAIGVGAQSLTLIAELDAADVAVDAVKPGP